MPAPLAGVTMVRRAAFPAAVVAGDLLDLLGARTPASPGPGRADLVVGSGQAWAVEGLDGPSGAQPDTVDDWLASGLEGVTRRGGAAPERLGVPATAARAATLAMGALSPALAGVDGAVLLNRHRAPEFDDRTVSVNGTARLLPAVDRWVVLNLPRPEDHEMVPALVGRELAGGVDELWEAVARAAADRPAADFVDRAGLLGLAAAAVGEGAWASSPWSIEGTLQAASPPIAAPLVVNLGSLWAAPLAAHLLSRTGCQVVNVESPQRPDGSRLGSPELYQALHAGQSLCTVDPATPAGRRELLHLIASAHVVITASRPQALHRLGVTPDAAGRQQVWLRIVGHRHAPDRAAFGDDAAVCGGLTTTLADRPGFLGDAIADPLTGTFGALAALACLRATGRWVIEIGLCETSAFARRCYPAPDASSP